MTDSTSQCLGFQRTRLLSLGPVLPQALHTQQFTHIGIEEAPREVLLDGGKGFALCGGDAVPEAFGHSIAGDNLFTIFTSVAVDDLLLRIGITDVWRDVLVFEIGVTKQLAK